MKKILTISLFAIAATSALASNGGVPPPVAADKPVSKSEFARISALVEKKVQLKVSAIETSHLKDFYTVVADGKVYYVEKGGQWLIDGHLVDMDTRRSVTAQKMAMLEADVPALNWRTLNLDDAVKTVRGTATPGRVLVSFEDPNCGWCKKLQGELNKIQNVTILTYPIALMGPDSSAKNEAMWCAKDRSASWAALMAGRPLPAEGSCDVAGLARNSKLATDLKVRGTPTLFFSDGLRVPGYMDAAALEALLVEQQNKK